MLASGITADQITWTTCVCQWMSVLFVENNRRFACFCLLLLVAANEPPPASGAAAADH